MRSGLAARRRFAFGNSPRSADRRTPTAFAGTHRRWKIAAPPAFQQIRVMLANLVMTVLSPDRPGLVETLAARVARHGGNWLESRMCRLGGQFTGIVRAEIPATKIDELTQALQLLEADGLRIHLHIEKADRPAVAGTLASLDFVGQDRPGILLQISTVLASHRVNVEELASERVSAPMDGNMLFQARATVLLPPDLAVALLRADLEKIAADLMVDVQLEPK
jgi:glycine cleavage system regulatory protein